MFCLKQKPSDAELMRVDRGGQCIVGREASSASRGEGGGGRGRYRDGEGEKERERGWSGRVT